MSADDVSSADALVGALLSTVNDAVWVVGSDHRLARFNRPFSSLWTKAFGIAPAAAAPAEEVFDDWWRDLTRRVLAGRNVTADTYLIVDGVDRHYLIVGTPVAAPGETAAAVFTARDVTDAVRGDRDDILELALTRVFAPETPLADVLMHVLEFVCESDGWDCAAIWLLDDSGQTLETAVLWTRPEVDSTRFRERMRALRFTRGHGAPGRAWATGDVVWIADLYDESGFVRAEVAAAAGLHGLAAIPLSDAGRIIGVMEIFTRAVRPISEQHRRSLARAGESLGRLIERRKLQELIERKSQEWTVTFDSLELPIFITDLGGIIIRINRAARDLAGGAFEEILGRPIATVAGEGTAGEEPWKTLADLVAAVRDSRTPCTAQITRADRFWDVSASWSRSDEEERAIIVMRETTDVVLLQESVRRGEQLAALGELVAGVAHEVRNPIFGMGLTVDTLQAMLPADPEFAELAGVLRTWLDRLNRLMESLLQYGKSWTLDLQPGDLAVVLEDVVDRARQLGVQSEVTIEASIQPDLPMLMDSTRLSQAFDNVLTNAIQHSGESDRIEVVARTLREGGRELIECYVRDHGPGFNPSDLPRVFQPFFTRRRGGTGLGLSIVQRVVDEHGGTISAVNMSDGGACIAMRFFTYRNTAGVPQ